MNKQVIGSENQRRDAFIKRVEEYVAGSRGTIQNQIRRIGASCDWSREAFTFDEARGTLFFDLMFASLSLNSISASFICKCIFNKEFSFSLSSSTILFILTL